MFYMLTQSARTPSPQLSSRIHLFHRFAHGCVAWYGKWKKRVGWAQCEGHNTGSAHEGRHCTSAGPALHKHGARHCTITWLGIAQTLQFLACCAAEIALQHSLFCNADVICTKSCAAANEKLHCNIEIAALQESGAFRPLSCGFRAPTFRHTRFRLAETIGNENQPEVFQTEVFPWTSAQGVRSKMLVFTGFRGPDRSFWPDVRRDIRPRTSSLG